MDIVDASAALTSISATYIDSENVSVRSENIFLEQNINIHFLNALSALNDTRINNYSALYLTNKIRGGDIFEYNLVTTEYKEIVPTYIAANSIAGINSTTRYLYIDEESSSADPTYTSYSLRLSGDIPDDMFNRTLFEIELLDNEHCRIYHRHENYRFYLTLNSSLEFYFGPAEDISSVSLSAITGSTFGYVIDRDSAKISIWKALSGASLSGTMVVGVSGSKLVLYPPASGVTTTFPSNKIFSIRYNVQEVTPKLNSSWVSYNINAGAGDLIINNDRSSYNLRNNFFISTQYSNVTGDSTEINVLTLKNHTSQKNYNIRGNYLELSNNTEVPPVDLRSYQSLHTGNHQERGDDSVTLDFTFYNTDYVFDPDKYNYFRTPKTMYPYLQLNVNDTLFVQNGSLGGDSPHTADRIYRKKTDTTSTPSDGQYLCTWLSAASIDDFGVWVDRYYYPKRTTIFDAMTGGSLPAYDYLDPIECMFISNAQLSAHISKSPYFDKLSDFVLEPDFEYVYHRIGHNYVKDLLHHLDDNLVEDGLYIRTGKNAPINDPLDPDDRTYVFNNNAYAMINDYEKFNNTSQYTISFWLNSPDWSVPMGHQILGNLNDQGLAVINEGRITPFITVQAGDWVYVFNTDFVQVDKVKIGEEIKDIIRTDHLDAFFVTTETNNLYKVHANGTVFDKKLVGEISGYVNYYNDKEYLYFLMSDDGDITTFNIAQETLSATSVPSTNVGSIIRDDLNQFASFGGEKAIRYSENSSMYMINNSLLIEEGNDHSTRFILLSSASILRDFAVDTKGAYYVLHNDMYVSKFSADREGEWIVSLSGTTIGQVSGATLAVDVVREFTSSGLKEYPIILSYDTSTNELYLTKIDENLNPILTTKLGTGITGEFTHICYGQGTRYNLTGYGYLRDKYDGNNSFKFNQTLINLFDNHDIVHSEMTYDVSKLHPGEHNFIYRFDAKSGNITLFIDGKRALNNTIRPGKYVQQTTSSDCYVIGATHFYNCILLAETLKQPNYYFVNNATGKHFKFFNTAIDDVDVKFLNLLGKPVDPVTVSLPSGQRNQLEQIQRFFKWNIPGNKSNVIKIHIKDNIVYNEALNERIKNEILSQIKDYIPTDTVIEDIVFDNYLK